MKAYTRAAKLALLLAASIFGSSSHAQVALNLTAGWNLLGNSSASAIDVATLFGDPAKFTTVWKWNRSASAWAFYAPSMTPSALATYAQSRGYDVLTSIAAKEGFWVNASTTAALNGPAASGVTLAESDLQLGWNLAGSADNKTPSELNQTLSSSLNAAGKAIVTAWAWDASQANWKFYAPALETQGTLATYIASKGYLPFGGALSASEGYWLNVGTASTTATTAQSTTTTSSAATTTSTAASTSTTTTTSTTAAATTTTTAATTTTTTLRASATNFTASAMAGELLTFTLDTSALTYSYTITESLYDLTGISRSGKLINNGDGTYTPSLVNNGTVATLPNGLLQTSIRETFNGVTRTIPVMGIANPVTTLSNTTFNFIQRSCWSGYCESDYGTFQLSTAGTWISCPSGNLNAGCSQGYYGTIKSLGGGMWQVFDALGVNFGTAVVLSSGGQQVVFLDLKDTRPYGFGFGVGLLVGSTQQTATTAQIDGTWVSASSDGDSAQFLVSGTQSRCLIRNGAPCSVAVGLTFDSPWKGFATTSLGDVALLAGTGMYALVEPVGNYVEIGIKVR